MHLCWFDVGRISNALCIVQSTQLVINWISKRHTPMSASSQSRTRIRTATKYSYIMFAECRPAPAWVLEPK